MYNFFLYGNIVAITYIIIKNFLSCMEGDYIEITHIRVVDTKKCRANRDYTAIRRGI